MEVARMKVAIIGAGNVGGALSKSFSRTGHSVIIADRDPEEAQRMGSAVGGSGTADVAQAVAQSEVVVLAVPFAASGEQVCKNIAAQVKGKIVIDATNPMKPDMSGLITEGGPSAAERIQEWLPSGRVIKAFNTVFASLQENPVTDGERVDGLVAGDDEQAKEMVLKMVGEIGFRPVDVGALARAKELEAMAYLNIVMQVAMKGQWGSSWKLLAPPARAVRVAATAQTGARR
jgi:8-hydroxy-5-deazaflavin:NADPH oxidoreductase